jgi:signal transduction histidine kinase
MMNNDGHMTDELLDISVLYVEDDMFALDLMTGMLRKSVKNLYLADNGSEGLELFRRHCPDVVLTDIRMPVMDGLEMSRLIKNDNSNAQIIVTTAFSDTNYLLECIDIGVNQYVLKPVDKGKLLSTLKRCADIVRFQRTIRLQAAAIKEGEERLRQAQKMEAIGQLAGGIAHDFNNILTAIIGYANLLSMKVEGDDIQADYVKHILSSAERAASLTQSLLAFSRKQIINPKPVDLNEIVCKVEKLLSRLIGEDIELKITSLGKNLTVLADGGQLEQVLMNLTTNARDAMPEGGLLTIETGYAEVDSMNSDEHLFSTPGEYALLSISDTGTGIDEKDRESIFEPFFTTKEVGKGTGLGLSIVYGIVKQHNGFINVYSKPGKGTTFRIYLPLLKVDNETEVLKAVSFSEGGSETILLAEDDHDVRNITREVLEAYGYRVLEAVDGEDALVVFEKHADEIDLLMMDVIMPRKNGREAYEEISRTRPGIKTLFLSGYTKDLVYSKGILETGMDFMSKPVSPDELLRKVRHVLDGETDEGGLK